jgi:Co/Zn/Cd efflux system component
MMIASAEGGLWQTNRSLSSHSLTYSGIFLHILADTLGSVAVIISSILIMLYDWRIADPICSLLLSALIGWSTITLLKSSVYTLLLRTPTRLEPKLSACYEKVRLLYSFLPALPTNMPTLRMIAM